MKTLPRLVDGALAARLRVMPAVVLTGARQTGKRTLVEQLVPGARRYRSLDDFDVRDAARRDPEALLGGDDALTLVNAAIFAWAAQALGAAQRTKERARVEVTDRSR